MRTLLAGILLAVCLGCERAAEPPEGAKPYPLWDGKESVADYARRTGLEPTKTIDLGKGATLECVLIPAGKFVMGTAEPTKPDELRMQGEATAGKSVVAGSGGILLVMVSVIVFRAARKRQRVQYSLAWLLAAVVVLGAGVLGGTHWCMMAAQLAREKAEYEAALERYQEADANEKPAYWVTISKPFYMGKYEVTQRQYQRVLGGAPSHFNGAKLPVEQVSWNDARRFCERASARSGEIVRLPTEAEWEYACRAGTQTRYHSGDSEADLTGVAWYLKNSHQKTHPVGTKTPNTWGLYDMHGNVEEWCQDWCGQYQAGAAMDPQGPASGTYCVLRGGSWGSNPRFCRSSLRSGSGADSALANFGFRLVVNVPRTP